MKEIPGYEACSDGSIWTCEGKTTYRILNGNKQKRVWKRRKMKPKYEKRCRSIHCDARVELWKDGKHETKLVSRLVASAFVDNPENKPEVNHIDGNPLNNSIKNLEWVTRSENIKHAIVNDLNSQHRKIQLINKSNREAHNFTSLSQASLFLGFNKGYVSNRLNQNKSIPGFDYTIIG